MLSNREYYNQKNIQLLVQKFILLEDEGTRSRLQYDDDDDDKKNHQYLDWDKTHPGNSDRLIALENEWNSLECNQKQEYQMRRL